MLRPLGLEFVERVKYSVSSVSAFIFGCGFVAACIFGYSTRLETTYTRLETTYIDAKMRHDPAETVYNGVWPGLHGETRRYNHIRS